MVEPAITTPDEQAEMALMFVVKGVFKVDDLPADRFALFAGLIDKLAADVAASRKNRAGRTVLDRLMPSRAEKRRARRARADNALITTEIEYHGR